MGRQCKSSKIRSPTRALKSARETRCRSTPRSARRWQRRPAFACQSAQQRLRATEPTCPERARRSRDWAPKSWWSIVAEISLKRGCNDSDERLRKEPEPKKRGYQQRHRKSQPAVKIDKIIAVLVKCSHKNFAIRPQHVNRRDHHAPKPKHGGDLKNVEAFDFPAVLKRAKENHHFAGEISKTGKADRGKGAESESKSGERHHFAETAEIVEE